MPWNWQDVARKSKKLSTQEWSIYIVVVDQLLSVHAKQVGE
jgi:hypothetical protein